MSAGALAAALAGWQPEPVESCRRVDPWAAAAFADLLDSPVRPAPGDPLPPLWHWFSLLDHPRQSALGADGHPAEGGFLPPLPDRRRMFAGGRWRRHGAVPVGSELACRSQVADVAVKTGRSGEMAFVTVRHELTVDGAPAATEEQDIVYRSEPAGAPVRRLERPAADGPPASGTWRDVQATDEALLFRFSALTYNAHRIHYDRTYATQVEGYPDLVVHGPLLALLALELPRVHAPGAAVTEFTYRLVRPAFVPADVEATATVDGPRLDIAVGAVGVGPSLTATAVLAGEG
ncbi:FAS1-like dehydratase domain-containing protein [Pseudonocardia kunmingensis]|uniref:3-methylfumaryl-CoA hydratase n=1 Tax=Pseudonocardia kunmingensis TaxID=630975 RepID=A0A543DR56_9PSEU|nr:MaoC family dehydratase N-terminal domain-containing protein [Pseudonocardia kunmingensis]TQM11784.1 3-methylfumaryl-CoA hydratase [Pseudonocardia kunmingensis]